MRLFVITSPTQNFSRSFHRKGSMFSLGNISHKIFNERFTMNTKFIHDLPGIILIAGTVFSKTMFCHFWVVISFLFVFSQIIYLPSVCLALISFRKLTTETVRVYFKLWNILQVSRTKRINPKIRAPFRHLGNTPFVFGMFSDVRHCISLHVTCDCIDYTRTNHSALKNKVQLFNQSNLR